MPIRRVSMATIAATRSNSSSSSMPIPAVHPSLQRSGQVAQECPGVQEIRRREALGVRVVNRREPTSGVVPAALPMPETGKAHRGSQFPRPAVLAAGDLDGIVKAGLRGPGVVRFGQQELALQTAQLGLLEAVVVPLRE